MKYNSGNKSKKIKKPYYIVLSVLLTLLLVIVIVGLGTNYWYNQQLKPKSGNSATTTIYIPTGYTTKQIANLLQDKGLIKSATAFEWYVRLHGLRESLKAGQYQLDASQTTPDIAYAIAEGKIKKDLFTILPGQRVDQIKNSLIKYGFKESDVNQALDPANYKNHPAMVAKPSNVSLEGYLYPETFQTTSNTQASEIIKQSLDQMSEKLTPDLINAFQKQGLGIHQAITLASIVEMEVSNAKDRKMVAGVFYNRIKEGMPLGADATYKYAAYLVGQPPNPFIESPYNTRKYTGLPPGPISNESKTSLEAVAYPIKHDYLFFVSGDDGNNYFSKTIEEHEALAKQHCIKLCSTY